MLDRTRTLPYLPFSDFRAGLDVLASNPVEHVDSSCWSRLPSLRSKASLLCAALHFLGFTTPAGKALPALQQVLDSSFRPQALAASLQRAYPFVSIKDLRFTTPARLKKIFMQQLPSRSMWRKAMSFYIKASDEAGIALHPRLQPREPRRRIASVTERLAHGAPKHVQALPIATRTLEGGGTLQLVLLNQAFDRLTADELEAVSHAALVIKGRKTPQKQGAGPAKQSAA